jgi:ubiquinone/menaquinone biosynthesis C-methylase UbiE
MARLNFGYLVRGSLKVDLLGRFFGEPNLLKRMQCDKLFNALDVGVGVEALDFGCGSGYLTVELARAGATATGIDINPFVDTIPIPSELAGRLSFQQSSGASLPFPDARFDVVLASEILPMLPEPDPFVKEIRRVIKSGGRLVVANNVGPIPIRKAYETNDSRLTGLKREFPQRFPESYAAYSKAFQRSAGTLRDDFLSLDEMTSLLIKHGFRVDSVTYSPTHKAGEWIAWQQFRHYLATGEIVLQLPFLRTFLYLSMMSRGDREGYEGMPIIVAYAD